SPRWARSASISAAACRRCASTIGCGSSPCRARSTGRSSGVAGGSKPICQGLEFAVGGPATGSPVARRRFRTCSSMPRSRALTAPCEIYFMAISSYGAATDSSGVVRILKDLDINIEGRHVLVVEDIIDSGLTLSYLLRNLESREPASLEICALLTKPDRREIDVPVRYVGFEIPNRFVIGYGLDFAERYRNLRYVGVLHPDLMPEGA